MLSNHLAAFSILVVDNQPDMTENIRRFLHKRGYTVSTSNSASVALEECCRRHFDLVLIEARMPDKTALEFLQQIAERQVVVKVLIMAAFATVEDSAEAMFRGAAYYIRKPFELSYLLKIVENVLKRPNENLPGSLLYKANFLSEEKNGNGNKEGASKNGSCVEPKTSSSLLIGQSAVMQKVYSRVEKIAQTDSSVLITGATGTGKELVARTIHDRSKRQRGAFIDLNCSAIPESLIEAELFGHQRGSFTGANETRKGLFEEASGGTLFLDEVDALIPSAQAKMLRVLQERQLRRVGGRENIPVDVRIISATNHDLNAAVASGAFRADLLFRLCVVPIHVPPLVERSGDIAMLIEHFLQRHSEKRSESVRFFSEDAMKALSAYNWPGNVRELENAIEYALAMGADQVLGIEDLPGDIMKKSLAAKTQSRKGHNGASMSLADIERQHILNVLEEAGGHHIKAASVLGIDRRTLHRKLSEYNVVKNNSKTSPF
jgi:DNA-binding NtrC family response regulator